KSVAANPALHPVIGPRINCRRRRHLAMKSRIEDSHLRHISQDARRDLHAFQCGGSVKWRKIGDAGNCRAYFGSNRHWLLKVRAPMNDAMSDGIDLRKSVKRAHLPIGERLQQILDDLLSRGGVELFFLDDSVRILYRNGCGATTELDFAFPQRSRRVI